MDVARAGQIVLIMLSPTLIIGAALYLPRWIRAGRRWLRAGRPSTQLQPVGPPIELLAADLRRLLLEHDAVRGATDIAMRARRLRALEGAISDCAIQAATALGVPLPDQPASGPIAVPELRRLLRAIAKAGLVLPARAGLLTGERHS
jgi:hypothetical protein